MKSSKSIPNAVRKNISDKEVRHINYPLYEILFIAIVAVTCGATSYQQIETFGNVQEKWFKKFLKLKNGIPSHDTFRRLFQLLNPVETLKFYQEMICGLSFDLKGKHIAVDGKTSRGCYNKKGKSLLHLVSAYETESGISLMQLPTKNEEGKDIGEFNTIPQVLERLDIKDTVVTIDAVGCYAEITDAVTKGGADYIITLKENQPTVYATAESLFAESASRAYEGVECYRETNRGHGREEERTYYALPVPEDKLPKNGRVLRR
jgi:predicted transposase YbfD/YdcC